MFYYYGGRGRPKVRVHCFACEARFKLPGTRTDKGVRCPECGEWNELGEPELQRVSKKTPSRRIAVEPGGAATGRGVQPLFRMTYIRWRILFAALALVFVGLWWLHPEFVSERFHTGVEAIEAQWRALFRF